MQEGSTFFPVFVLRSGRENKNLQRKEKTMNQEHPLYPRLEALAWQKSKPFCYGCYVSAP
jgi:hypothetical protein